MSVNDFFRDVKIPVESSQSFFIYIVILLLILQTVALFRKPVVITVVLHTSPYHELFIADEEESDGSED